MAPKKTSTENGTKSKNLKKSASIVKSKSNTNNPDQFLRMKCPICFENINKDAVSSTKCGHVFCTECLQKALKRMCVCPNCRTRLKGPNGHHPLYLDTDMCGDVHVQSEVLIEVSND